MKDKHPKEKRVSWGGINYGRYSITDKDDSNDQVADSDSTLPKAVDTMNLKNMDNHILLEESIRLEEHNPFLEENKSNLDKKESVKPIENFDKNLTNKISNPHQPKNEETIISSSVKHKIDFFEQKTAHPDQSVQKKEENTTVLLNTSTFDICFPNENMSGEMDTKKFNEIFKCSKLTQENLEENYNEDVMNTVNMKHLLNMAPFNPIDELIKRGIRFYISDKIFFKRTSVYLSSQRSHPKLYYFNKYFNKPLCDFYNNFIQTLLNLHEEIKDEHLRLAKLINQEMFNKENIDSLLFELKGLSSTIYKISWYNLCKKEEFQFYNLIKENKNKIEDEFADLKKEKDRKIESIRNKEEKLKKLQERLSTNTKNCNFSSEKEDINLTHLEKMVQDSKSVNESYQREILELTEKVSENLILFNNLNLKITKYKEEINELNLKIKNKSINEKDYLEIRDKFKKVCSISGLEILKASENIFNIKVGEYICEFIISPGNILLIDDYTISTNNKENRSLILFFISNLNLKNETLRNAISKILEINVKVKSILKDINLIKFNSIISYNEGNDCLIIKIKKFNKKIEEKEIILKIKKDFSKEVMINNEIIMVSDYGYMSEAFRYI